MKKRIFLTFFVLTILVSGCSERAVRTSGSSSILGGSADKPIDKDSRLNQPGEIMGPMPAPAGTTKENIVLLFGPGLARCLAFVGVLHEFDERKIDIRAVVGVEMGALVAGLWASSNLNTLEWEMYKFKRDTLLDLPLLSMGNKAAEGKKVFKFLENTLKVDQLQSMRLPFYVASISAQPSGNEFLLENNGSTKDVIRGALGIPGILKSHNYGDKERESAGLEAPFPAGQVKKLGLGRVVCVDVLGRGNNFSPHEPIEFHLSALMKTTATLAREQAKECDSMITIPMDGISYLSFDSRAELIYRGRTATMKWMSENAQLVGK